MIWLLSRLWAFGLVALVAGFALTWFTVVQKRTVRARVLVDRVHAAHARSGSTKSVGSSLEELHDEDVIVGRVRTRSAPRTVGTEIAPRRSGTDDSHDEPRSER